MGFCMIWLQAGCDIIMRYCKFRFIKRVERQAKIIMGVRGMVPDGDGLCQKLFRLRRMSRLQCDNAQTMEGIKLPLINLQDCPIDLSGLITLTTPVKVQSRLNITRYICRAITIRSYGPLLLVQPCQETETLNFTLRQDASGKSEKYFHCNAIACFNFSIAAGGVW